MLDALRKGAGTWLAKLFIALLIFSFAIWGVTDFLQGVGQNTAAEVGDKEVSLLDYDRAYRQDLNRFGQQLGRALTPAEGAQFGIAQQTLGRLIAEAALDNASAALKLGISDTRLATIIQSDPAFQGLAGGYDRSRLQQVLSANGYREDEFVLERRRLAERNQIIEALTGGMSAPRSYLEVLDAYQRESRTVEYLVIGADQIGAIETPADDVLTAYYEDNKVRFRAPEYREIKYLQLTPAELARPEDVVEADALADYERRADNYAEPERRQVRQLSFSTTDDAQAAADALAGGATFESVMAERDLTDADVSLGVMARSDFLDDTIGDAVFALTAGQSSGVVDGRFSTVIVNVPEIMPARTTPFEDVRDEIVEELALEQAEREILDLFDEIEDARAGGALLDEVGERFSVAIAVSEPFDASGNTTAGTPSALPEADGLVAGVFTSDIGIENEVIDLAGRGYLWYEVTKVTPARDRDLEEVKDDVIAAWQANELTSRLDSKADELLAAAEGGKALADLATENAVELQTADAVVRNRPAGVLGPEAVAAAFDGSVGTAARSASADGTARIILKAVAADTPAFNATEPDVVALAGQVAAQMQESVLGQYIAEQQALAGVVVNNAGIAQIIGLDGTN